MTRSREFFVQEAEQCLSEARGAMAARDAAAAHGAVRRLRGSAQMARLEGLAEEALALEIQLRSAAGPNDDIGPAALEALDRLAARVDDVPTGPADQAMTEERMDERSDGDGPEGDGRPVTGPVPLEALEYSGAPALDRAIDLRRPLENALVSEEPIGPILDELFDLIRLGRK